MTRPAPRALHFRSVPLLPAGEKSTLRNLFIPALKWRSGVNPLGACVADFSRVTPLRP